MKKRYKYTDGYLSRDLLYQKFICYEMQHLEKIALTPLRILKIITVGLKKWILELSHAIKIVRF